MSIPGAASPLFLATTGEAAAFEISRSLRFNSADTPYLNRTPSSASNRKTWTWSAWVKKARVGEEGNLFTVGASSTDAKFRFNGNDTLEVSDGGGGQLTTAAVFRDTSAWYHIVVLLDNTQATAANRFKLYINGSEAVVTGSPSSQNADGDFNTAVAHYIGRQVHNTANLFNGYLAEINFVDGSALDPTSFGAFDDNGVWQAIDTAGLTFGTNGFRLQFADNSGATATTLGKDTSGNSNNFTPNNLSVTAGSGNDSLVDTPSNGDTASDTGAGGEITGCYATLNPLDRQSTNGTLSNGNLDLTSTGANWAMYRSTIFVSSGKWYWECTLGNNQYSTPGICTDVYQMAESSGNWVNGSTEMYGLYIYNGKKYNGDAGVAYATADTTAAGSVIGLALDLDNGTLTFYKDGASLGTAYSGLTGKNISPTHWVYQHSGVGNADVYNFGQRAFAYTAPSGYKSLNTASLPTPTIADGSKYFDTKLWSGNSSARSITGYSFAPSFAWIKRRNASFQHVLQDVVRGTSAMLASDSTGSEAGFGSPPLWGYINAFNSDGFSLATGGNGYDQVNVSGSSYVGWAWAGGTSTVTNNDGSIASQVRVNQTAGFSIVTYTGVSGNQSFGHGLNVKPKFIAIKNRSNSANWFAMFDTGATHYQYGHLNDSAAFAAATAQPVTNSTITYGNNNSWFGAAGDNYLALCFAPVEGYSAIGTYQGNGNVDGPFIYTGMRTKWLLIKAATGSAVNWYLYDTVRSEYNVTEHALKPNNNDAEGSTSNKLDILSNGFKWRNSGTSTNVSGVTYVYAAFASNPFQANGGLAR